MVLTVNQISMEIKQNKIHFNNIFFYRFIQKCSYIKYIYKLVIFLCTWFYPCLLIYLVVLRLLLCSLYLFHLWCLDVCTLESDVDARSGGLVGGLGDLADSTFPDDNVLSGSCCTLGDGELGEGDDVVVRVGVLDLTLRAGDGAEQVL
mgnify:CR=1 FL=1|jgi:hypothetical protein